MVSEAKKKANAKYEKKTYDKFSCRIRKEDTPNMLKYMEQNNCPSKNKLFLAMLKYCTENNVDLTKYM